MLIVGGILIIVGIGIIVRGKIPFISNYNGVREGKESLHCRIEGGAGIIVGMILLLTHFLELSSVTIVILIIITCILAFTLEIVLKVIK